MIYLYSDCFQLFTLLGKTHLDYGCKVCFCLFFFFLIDATIGPSALWSRVQMSSLTPARGPTSTWRSSMSVCPTVSTPPLSWIENPPFLTPNHPILSFSNMPPHSLLSHHLLSHSIPLPRPEILLSPSATPSSTLFSTVSSSICVTLWTFHEIWPVKHSGFSSVLPLLLMCSPCFQRIDEPGYVVAE